MIHAPKLEADLLPVMIQMISPYVLHSTHRNLHETAYSRGTMHDLRRLDMTTASQSRPKGIAFEIVDLILIKKWADTRNIRFVIHLDHGVEGEEYEEVVAFHPETSATCPLIMWRTAPLVFVQPLIGSRRRFGSVAKALDSQVMATMPCTILTDITMPACTKSRASLSH
jgi:hypothetical protein